MNRVVGAVVTSQTTTTTAEIVSSILDKIMSFFLFLVSAAESVRKHE